MPNIFEIMSFPFGLLSLSLNALSAQKEKNIFTLVSIAAAASARTIAARILSISPETTAIES